MPKRPSETQEGLSSPHFTHGDLHLPPIKKVAGLLLVPGDSVKQTMLGATHVYFTIPALAYATETARQVYCIGHYSMRQRLHAHRVWR